MRFFTRLFMKYFAGRMKRREESRLFEQMVNLPLNITVIKDIPYVDDGKSEHRMDLYYPENMEPVMLPTIVNIHGDCFVYGDKEYNQAYNMRMAQNGFAVIALDYGMTPKANFLEQIRDIMNALHHIENNADKYPCNPECMFLTGDSSGAFLALYTYAVNGNNKIAKAFGVESTRLVFKALGFISGLFYLRGTSVRFYLRQVKTCLFPLNYTKMEFYPYMKLECLLQACGLPPCYLQTSREDILRDHTLEFEVELARRGVCHKLNDWELYENKKLPHRFPLIHPEWEESYVTIHEMAAFFRSQYEKEFQEPA